MRRTGGSEMTESIPNRTFGQSNCPCRAGFQMMGVKNNSFFQKFLIWQEYKTRFVGSKRCREKIFMQKVNSFFALSDKSYCQYRAYYRKSGWSSVSEYKSYDKSANAKNWK